MTTVKDYTSAFRIYFEGFYMEGYVDLAPADSNPCPVSDLEITSFKLEQTETEDILTISTCRPGILIGKGGRRIDALKAYLQEAVTNRGKEFEKTLRIVLIEDRMWN